MNKNISFYRRYRLIDLKNRSLFFDVYRSALLFHPIREIFFVRAHITKRQFKFKAQFLFISSKSTR